MKTPILALFCLDAVLRAVVVAAVADVPVKTPTLSITQHWTRYPPAPTQAPYFPVDLFRRQQGSFSSVCGYVDGNASEPYTCNSGFDCGFNSANHVFGCCGSVVSSSSFLTDCLFITTCLDSTAFSASCNDSCQTNVLAGWCTLPQNPYCETYIASTYTGYDCGPLSGMTYSLHAFPTNVSATTTTTPSSSSNSTTTSSSSSGSSGSTTSISTSGSLLSSSSSSSSSSTTSQQSIASTSASEPQPSTASSNFAMPRYGSQTWLADLYLGLILPLLAIF